MKTRSPYLNNTPLIIALLSVILCACGGANNESSSQVSAPNQIENVSINSITEYIEDQNFSGAILIIDQNEYVINKGFGLSNRAENTAINSDTIFRLGSITKQFTATAILLLQQQGFLNINDTLSYYLADYPNGDVITIKHLLQHTAGIPNYTSLSSFSNIMTRNHSPEELVSLFKNLPLEFTPGSRFNYSNSGYALLGYLIEVISDSTYQDFIKNQIFIPLKMTRSGYGDNNFSADNTAYGYTRSGQNAFTIDMSVPYAAGALASTLHDLFLWDQSFYNNSLLTLENKVLLYTPGLNNYALGWSIDNSTNTDVYSHGGGINGFSTYIIREPSQQRLIVVLSNQEGYDAAGLAYHLNSLLK